MAQQDVMDTAKGQEEEINHWKKSSMSEGQGFDGVLGDTNDVMIIADSEEFDKTKNWLNNHGLSSIAQKCLQNDISIDALMEADANDIKIMCTDAQIKVQHRLKIQSALKITPDSYLSLQKTPEPPVYSDNETDTKTQTNEEVKVDIKNDLKDRKIDFSFKTLLIGDSGVGKTCILRRFREDTFSGKNIATVGVDFAQKKLEINDKIIKLLLWDTAGQETFRSITASYYKGAHAVCIVYNITDKESFEHVEDWLGDVRELAMEDINIFIVGTQRDLEDRRVVTFEEGQSFANENNCKFCEVSSQSGRNIPTLFNAVAMHLMETQPKLGQKKDKNKKTKTKTKAKKIKNSKKNIKLHANNSKTKKTKKWC